MRFLLVICPAFFLTQIANAQTGTFSEAYIGCINENAYDEMQHAVNNNDKRLLNTMIGKTCVIVKGFEFSVLDRGFLTSTVRVYVGDKTVDLIVASEAIK